MQKNLFQLAKKQLIHTVFLLLVIKNVWAGHYYDTIIIGAGVSGLTAAKQLHQAHQDVLILEAKNRIGGRVNTNYDWGFPIELGASWIHGIQHNPLIPLLGTQSIAATTYSNADPVVMLRDFALYDSKGNAAPQTVLQQFSSLTYEFLAYCHTRKQTLSFEQNFSDFSQKKQLTLAQSTLLHYALDNIYTYEFADNLSQLALNSYFDSDKSTVAGTNAIIQDGYIRLFQQFSQQIPLVLNQIVREIDYDAHGVHVITQNNTYHARHVILSVSLGVLKSNKIRFRPDLPKDKQEAIAQLQMGNYEKLYLLFDKAFWDQDKEWIGMIPRKSEEAYNIFNLYKYTKKPILIVFTSGALARKMDKAPLTSWVMRDLRLIYGKNIPQPLKNHRTHWASDPQIRGSYSYLPKNVDKKMITQLAKPVSGTLFFAGEATSITDLSTVHGAYLSGIRVAQEVLSASSTTD